MKSMLEARTAPALVLAAGLALVCLGLAAESQSNGGQNDPPKTTSTPPISAGFGTADSNASMIAVTGVDVTGGSILYLIDTQSHHLSVYTAQGGTSSTSNIKWVGARNLALDFQVDGFNDKSELSYKELAKQFADGGANATAGKH